MGQRGRIVMLVDNAVRADSRVQKQARSAAAAGWDVTLLGVNATTDPNAKPEAWRIGDAEVRLLPLRPILDRRPHEHRRAWLRWPLAYPPTGIAERRAAWLAAQRADLATHVARLAVQPPERVRRAQRTIRRQRVRLHLIERWVRLRTRMLRRARTGRRFRNPWDRAYTWFWQWRLGERAWRRLEPGLWDYELACGPTVDALEPDLIHANDFRMLGVGARAAMRARAAGRAVKLVWDAHEFLPGLPPWRDHDRWLPGNQAHEREYARYADAVLTVSGELADLLQREHQLPARPTVILNAPEPGAAGTPLSDVRRDCGLDTGTPLLAYCGGATAVRGLDTLLAALPALPELHVALVSVPIGGSPNHFLRTLLARAQRAGLRERLHLLPYVPHDQVAAYLATADAGYSGLRHLPNHEIALSNKFFEYAHARLPLVVSDVRTMAATVRATGLGEVFRAGDPADLVRALTTVLAEPKRYQAAYDQPGLLTRWSWPAQAEVLDRVYSDLVPSTTTAPAA